VSSITLAPSGPEAPAARDAPVHPSSPDWTLWAVSVLSVLTALVAARHAGPVVDDSYITYRYAQNLAAGHGWAYNIGTTVHAATSPLYVLVLAGPIVIGLTPTMASNVISVLSVAVAATCTFVIVRRTGPTAAGVLAAVFVVANPWFPLYRGMETTMVIGLAAALIMTAFGPHVVRREWVVGLLAGTLLVARNDTLILVGIVGLLTLWTQRRVLWRAGLVAGGLIGTWSAIAWAWIGTPLPETLGAKIAQGRSGYWSASTMTTGWMPPIQDNGLWPWLVTLVVLAAIGTVGGLLRRDPARLVVITLVAWPAFHMLAYAVVLRVPGYYWYFGPVVFCLAALAGLGTAEVLAVAGRVNPRLVLVLATVTGVVFLALVVPRYTNGVNYEVYHRLALWIRANTEPDATVAATEIGYLGYVSERPIVDYLGLLDRVSADELARHDLQSWLYRTEPDVVVTHRPAWSLESPALAAPGFLHAYRLTAGSHGLWVFTKQAPLDPTASGSARATPLALLRGIADRGIDLDPADREALDAVIAALIQRNDLHEIALTHDGVHVDLVALLDWAAAAADADGIQMHPALQRSAFVDLAAKLRRAGSPVVPLTETLDER
jgi:hypothetical protein